MWFRRDAGRCPGLGCPGGCADDVCLQTLHICHVVLMYNKETVCCQRDARSCPAPGCSALRAVLVMCVCKQRICQLMLRYTKLMFGNVLLGGARPGLMRPLRAVLVVLATEGQHVQQSQSRLPAAAGWQVDYLTRWYYHYT